MIFFTYWKDLVTLVKVQFVCVFCFHLFLHYFCDDYRSGEVRLFDRVIARLCNCRVSAGQDFVVMRPILDRVVRDDKTAYGGGGNGEGREGGNVPFSRDFAFKLRQWAARTSVLTLTEL